MKKKKLEAKLTKTKKKLAAARTELDAMLSMMEASGMPKAGTKPVAGKTETPKEALPNPAAKSPSKPSVKPKTASAAPRPAKKTRAK